MHIQKVSPVGRFVRQALRVRHIFVTKPRARREKVGLHWHTPLLDLKKSYQLANRLRGHYPRLSYSQWQEEVAGLTSEDRRKIIKDLASWQERPRFWAILFASIASVDRLSATIKSLQAQLYANIVAMVIVPDDELAELRAALGATDRLTVQSLANLQCCGFAEASMPVAEDWLMAVPPGTVLAEHAVYWFAKAALTNRACRILYSDHDYLDAEGRRVDPEFKPDWSPELLRSSNYINSALAVRCDLAATISSARIEDAPAAPAQLIARTGVHDFLLRAAEQISWVEVQHVPAVLLHLPMDARLATTASEEVLLRPVADHLCRLGINAEVTQTDHGYCRVRYRLPTDPPTVSIIIPTRDGLQHLRPCVESVLSKSTYPNFEVLIVDNQSTDPDTLGYLAGLQERPQVRVLPYPLPFNFSAINNFAARAAFGNVLCLLNNDTEVISPDWLEEMVGHLLQPAVGVVGAKLYFADGRVQHAGDTVGPGGCAHHLHSFLEHGAPGYCGRAVQAQDLSAVTGACLLTWKDLYQNLGGLDEANLPVAFNDVDYCLRVREAKRRVIWTPYAELSHHESVSRGKNATAESAQRAGREVRFMRKRWQHVLHHDPFYNPNLSYEHPDFSLSHAPVITKPWLL